MIVQEAFKLNLLLINFNDLIQVYPMYKKRLAEFNSKSSLIINQIKEDVAVASRHYLYNEEREFPFLNKKKRIVFHIISI